MAKQLLEKQKEVEDARREAEEKMKKGAEEKAAREEAARVELEKKKAKEEKIQKRSWELKKLLAEQREMYETKLEKIVRRGIKGVNIGKKETAAAAQVQSSSEDEDEEAVLTPLVDKRKRRDSTENVENSPPAETPSKLGKKEDTSTPTSSKRKGRGRPTKAEAQANRMARGDDPWEGVPTGDKFVTESAFRKAVQKTLGSLYPETLQLMCKGAMNPPRRRTGAAKSEKTERALSERWAEHVGRTLGNEWGKNKLHSWLRKWGLKSYIAIPVAIVEKKDLEGLEARLIKRWCPVLNTSGWRDGRNRKVSKKRGRKGRRERKRERAVWFDKEKVLKFSSEGLTGVAKLTDTITAIKGKRRRDVVSSGGKIWAEDWGVIKRRFGESDLLIREEATKLKKAKVLFEEGGTIHFVRIRERKPSDPKLVQQLHQLLRCPWKRNKLGTLGLEELAVLFQNIKTFSRKSTRKTLKAIVDGVVKKKFNVSLRRRLVVGAKYDERIPRAEVRKKLVGKIKQGCSSETEARIRCQKLRLVWRKNQTVDDLLHSH
ncbi:hypothetical protein CBR_g18788 [Chara braunii]|uniref:Uncharacterized protein n=1 Tax=Chara braunii TaxID=69332 RepID=A0A388KWF9_CHABU|nr:hypothetical protein CBR_g18788 [Chara braunii]|eukprot:GBG74377.1 hypothetical protein CBR_g18788 [Chara braunii]